MIVWFIVGDRLRNTDESVSPIAHVAGPCCACRQACQSPRSPPPNLPVTLDVSGELAARYVLGTDRALERLNLDHLGRSWGSGLRS